MVVELRTLVGTIRCHHRGRASLGSMFAASIFAVSVLLLHPADRALAQSVDDCMSTDAGEAISICGRIVQNGSRNADVFWKLASALHQGKRTNDAKDVLAKALSLHPGNDKLETLNRLIHTASTEEEQLEASAQRNQSVMNKGALKIACLIRNSIDGMNACIDYLELTDDDADRIRARLGELESQFAADTPALTAELPGDSSIVSPGDTAASVSTDDVPGASTGKASTVEANPIRPADTPAVTAESTNDDEATTAQEQAYRQMVSDIQNGLNALGFDAGIADGIAGRRTQDALYAFKQRTGMADDVSIGPAAIRQLRDASSQLAAAETLLAESRQLADEGEPERATDRLDKAEFTSPLLSIPSGYRESLATRSNAGAAAHTDTAIQTQSDATTAGESAEPAVTDTRAERTGETVATMNQSTEFGQLMEQIRSLRNRMAEQQSTQAIRMEVLREQVSNAIR